MPRTVVGITPRRAYGKNTTLVARLASEKDEPSTTIGAVCQITHSMKPTTASNRPKNNRRQFHPPRRKRKNTHGQHRRMEGLLPDGQRTRSQFRRPPARHRKWRCPTQRPQQRQLPKHCPATGGSPYSSRTVPTAAGRPTTGNNTASKHADPAVSVCISTTDRYDDAFGPGEHGHETTHS